MLRGLLGNSNPRVLQIGLWGGVVVETVVLVRRGCGGEGIGGSCGRGGDYRSYYFNIIDWQKYKDIFVG